jgi:hypothetical protein
MLHEVSHKTEPVSNVTGTISISVFIYLFSFRSEVIPLAAPERLSSDGDEFGAGFNVNTITQIHFRTRGSKSTIVDMERGSLDLPKSLSNGF